MIHLIVRFPFHPLHLVQKSRDLNRGASKRGEEGWQAAEPRLTCAEYITFPTHHVRLAFWIKENIYGIYSDDEFGVRKTPAYSSSRLGHPSIKSNKHLYLPEPNRALLLNLIQLMNIYGRSVTYQCSREDFHLICLRCL